MTTITNNLEIVRTLGVGGMATVYLARRDEGGVSREVAVKKLHSFLAADPMSVALLEDEAQLGACISHPNVVGVIDYVPSMNENDSPSLVLEWIEGVDLAKLVRACTQIGRRLPLDVAAAIVRDLLAGLHAAHESRRDDGLALDIVHRDVSPQNVLVGFDGVVRVTDFGVAKATWRSQHTVEGAVKGKLGYLAPEQLSGVCDRRSDLFGAGVVLWELLTGARMRSGDGVEVLVEILCAQIAAPSSHNSEAACLDEIVMRALERDADARFANAQDMIDALVAQVVPASAPRVAEIVREILDAAEAPKSIEPAAVDAIEAMTVAEEIESIDLHIELPLTVPTRRFSRAPGRIRRPARDIDFFLIAKARGQPPSHPTITRTSLPAIEMSASEVVSSLLSQ